MSDLNFEELDLFEKLSMNNTIKIENENLFQHYKHELMIKLEKNKKDKEIKDNMLILHQHPLKKENSYLNDKDKTVYFDVNNFKNILSQQVNEKNEKDIEIADLKEMIKTLNHQMAAKDEVINQNFEINQKYNDLLREFFNLQEERKKFLNENESLKMSITEISGLNDIILKKYQNKLYEFGDYSNKLFSVYFDSETEKNQ